MDKNNHYQETAAQLRQKIKQFKKRPSLYCLIHFYKRSMALERVKIIKANNEELDEMEKQVSQALLDLEVNSDLKTAQRGPHHRREGGRLCWWKEVHRDLRAPSPAESIPEDADQAGERAREEVQRQARRIHCAEKNPAKAHQEGQQAEAEEA